jgi:hypothetical protein
MLLSYEHFLEKRLINDYVVLPGQLLRKIQRYTKGLIESIELGRR